jgi:hypothetical protein
VLPSIEVLKVFVPGKMPMLKIQQGSKTAASKVKRSADPKQSARPEKRKR